MRFNPLVSGLRSFVERDAAHNFHLSACKQAYQKMEAVVRTWMNRSHKPYHGTRMSQLMSMFAQAARPVPRYHAPGLHPAP